MWCEAILWPLPQYQCVPVPVKNPLDTVRLDLRSPMSNTFRGKRGSFLVYHNNLASNNYKFQMKQKVVNKANKIVGFQLKGILVQETKKSFLVCTRPWLYLSWNILFLSSHPIYRRTLTLLNESNGGPQSTLSRFHILGLFVWRKTGNAWVVQSPIKEVLFIFVRVL